VGKYAPRVLNLTGGSPHLWANLGLTGLNFVGALLPLAAVGWLRLRRRVGVAIAAALGAITVIELIFFARYSIPDQFTYFLPSLMLIGAAAAVGLAVVGERSRRGRIAAAACVLVSLAAGPALYAAGPALLRRAGIEVRRERALPFRDEVRYWLVPWKHDERSAERFARAALDQAGAAGEAVLVADTSSRWPLRIVQARDGRWPGVRVSDGRELLGLYARDCVAYREALGEGRVVFVVSPGMSVVNETVRANLSPPTGDEVLWRLRD